MTETLLHIAAGVILGFALGLVARDRRRMALAENNHWLGEDHEAVKSADLLADVAAHRRHVITDPALPALNAGQACTAYVASILGRYARGRHRIAGPIDAVPLAREVVGALLHIPEGRLAIRAALAETGEPELHDQDAGPELAEVYSIARQPRLPVCQTCRGPARWAWRTQEGYDLAACDTCVEPWWPDGIDLLVVRDLAPVVSD